MPTTLPKKPDPGPGFNWGCLLAFIFNMIIVYGVAVIADLTLRH